MCSPGISEPLDQPSQTIPSLCNCQNLVCKQANPSQTEISLKLEYGEELAKHWAASLSGGKKDTQATGGGGEFSAHWAVTKEFSWAAPLTLSGLENHLFAVVRPEKRLSTALYLKWHLYNSLPWIFFFFFKHFFTKMFNEQDSFNH